LRIFRNAGVVVALPLALLVLAGCGDTTPVATAVPMSVDDFRRELLNVPICGTPKTGPLAGKAMCTIHFSDGNVTLAGAGTVARGVWEVDGNTICRRDIRESADQRRCVTYDRLSNGRYRNSDGVEFCLGPCPDPPR
jgi:hypothetical protein